MRVISGIARGTKLIAPKTGTRPTSDRAKESIFNIIAEKIPDSNFLDIFAGSGSIGIEALSRRAKHAVFIDNSQEAIKVIKKNLEKTKLSDRAMILDNISKIERQDAVPTKNNTLLQSTFVGATVPGRPFVPAMFDIIFLDPPFDKNLIEPTLDIIIDKKILAPKGIIIIEKPTGLPEQTGDRGRSPVRYSPAPLQITQVRIYGRSSFVFLEEI